MIALLLSTFFSVGSSKVLRKRKFFIGVGKKDGFFHDVKDS